MVKFITRIPFSLIVAIPVLMLIVLELILCLIIFYVMVAIGILCPIIGFILMIVILIWMIKKIIDYVRIIREYRNDYAALKDGASGIERLRRIQSQIDIIKSRPQKVGMRPERVRKIYRELERGKYDTKLKRELGLTDEELEIVHLAFKRYGQRFGFTTEMGKMENVRDWLKFYYRAENYRRKRGW